MVRNTPLERNLNTSSDRTQRSARRVYKETWILPAPDHNGPQHVFTKKAEHFQRQNTEVRNTCLQRKLNTSSDRTQWSATRGNKKQQQKNKQTQQQQQRGSKENLMKLPTEQYGLQHVLTETRQTANRAQGPQHVLRRKKNQTANRTRRSTTRVNKEVRNTANNRPQ